MKKILKYVFLVLFLLTVSLFVLAEDNLPPGVDIPQNQGPSQEEISSFEREFGAPPQAFQTPFERPKIEQPGKVPEEVKQYVSDKDLVEVYCAMTRWKSGQFLLAMSAIKQFIIPAVEKVKQLGVEVDMPDIDSIESEGQLRIESICKASTLAEAEKLTDEFYQWGQTQAQDKFDLMQNSIQEKMKAKGDEIRQKVKAEIDPFIEEQKAEIEKDLREEAETLAKEKEAEFANSETPPDIEAIKADITAKIQAKIDAKKAELQVKIEDKVNEIIGGKKEQFEEIGKLFEGIEQKINSYIKDNESKYDQYKDQAFALRKKLVFQILDKNIEKGLEKLEEASADIEEARKDDPSIKTVLQIKSEIEQDKKTLELKIDQALLSGDEIAFQNALNDFKVKWEGFRQEAEKAASQSVSKACTIALAQFGKAKEQMDPNIKKIEDVQNRCKNNTSEECARINEFAPRFNTLTAKITDIKSEMAMAEKMCQTPETADRQNLISLMKKIQSDAEDLKTYGQALEAEKIKAIADSAKKACSQIIPQLSAAKTELSKNDLMSLKNRITSCQGKTTEECQIVNQLKDKVNKLSSEVNDFTASIAKVESFCQDPTEEKFEEIRDALSSLKERGQELKLLASELKAEQLEKASEKALCKAVVSQFSLVKSDISSGLTEANNIFTPCTGKKDENCTQINALRIKLDEIKNKANGIFTGISKLEDICRQAVNEEPRKELLAILDSLKKENEDIKKMISDLKKESEKMPSGTGIRIEAEQEASSSLLPKTEPWHSRKETNPSWRPPYYGTGVWYLSRGGEFLTYSFNSVSTGSYNIWVRDYVDKFQPKGVRVIIVDFDGKRYGIFPEVDKSAPGDKGIFGWHKIGNGIKLSSGSHLMKITKESTTAGAAILDAFYLTTGSEIPPEK